MEYLIKNGAGTYREAGDIHIENIVTAVHGLGASMARAALSGSHGPTLNTKCSRLYFLLSGSCTVTVDGIQMEASNGDTVLAPRNSVHRLDGSAQYLIINIPEFDPATEVSAQ